MTHEDYKELLAANALTALDAADARALNAHLTECADCRDESMQWETAAASLAFEAQPLEPSDRVREQILATAREDQQGWKRESKVLQFTAPRRDVWASLRSFGAIAAALVFVALIASLVLLWKQNRATQSELTRLSSELKQTQAQVDHERDVIALLTAPDAHMAKLSGTPMAPDARAMIAYDQSGHAMLMAKGLPMAPRGMAYQLWFIKDNKKMPGRVFKIDASGNGILEDEIPTVARNAAVFAITLEPESGVQVPTGSIYLVSAS